jgi:hypothetical protein
VNGDENTARANNDDNDANLVDGVNNHNDPFTIPAIPAQRSAGDVLQRGGSSSSARSTERSRRGYVCIDASSDGKFLSKCRHCRKGKVYGAYYNAAAHLRRAHFHPRNLGRKNRNEEKRGGVGGGDDPPMDHLKQYWIKEIEVDEEAGNKQRREAQRLSPRIYGDVPNERLCLENDQMRSSIGAEMLVNPNNAMLDRQLFELSTEELENYVGSTSIAQAPSDDVVQPKDLLVSTLGTDMKYVEDAVENWGVDPPLSPSAGNQNEATHFTLGDFGHQELQTEASSSQHATTKRPALSSTEQVSLV